MIKFLPSIFLLIFFLTGFLFAQTTVLPGDGKLSQAIRDAVDGDVLQLVPTGLYTESDSSSFGTLAGKSIVIEVEGEDPEKAKLQFLNVDSPTFFYLADGSSITLRDLEIDGTQNSNPTAETLINFELGTPPAETNIGTIRIENCYIHDLTNHVIKSGNSDQRGFLLIDSTFVENVVMEVTGTSVYYKYAGANFVSVKNSTFNTIESYGIRIAGPGETAMPDHTPTVVIDRTTWYNIGTTDGREIILLEKGPNLNPWTVTNTICVKQINKDKIVINIKETTGDSLATITNICLWDIGDREWRNHLVQDTITMDPAFADPDNGDFTLPVGSPLLTFASNGGPIGDPRWGINAPTAIDSEDGSMVLKGFTLSQNYPNPFNPTTSVVFNLEKSGVTVLSVYDLLGKKVAELVNGHLSAGEHQIEFNAADFPSGIYIYRLTASGQTLSRKMMLMK
jgi:hypothetical protein